MLKLKKENIYLDKRGLFTQLGVNEGSLVNIDKIATKINDITVRITTNTIRKRIERKREEHE